MRREKPYRQIKIANQTLSTRNETKKWNKNIGYEKPRQEKQNHKANIELSYRDYTDYKIKFMKDETYTSFCTGGSESTEQKIFHYMIIYKNKKIYYLLITGDILIIECKFYIQFYNNYNCK